MSDYAELKYRIRDFFVFSPREMRDLFIAMTVITLAFAYDDGSESFQLGHWIFNYLKIFFIVAIAFFFHESAHKIMGLSLGIRTEYKLWTLGTYITLICTFLFQGKIYILLTGGVAFYHMTIQRLGHFRYGLNLLSCGLVGAMGPIANLVMATFWETLALNGIMTDFFHQMTFINLYYAVFSMLPLPNLDGISLFFASRMNYVFFFSIFLSYIVLFVIGVYSLIWALLLAGVIWGLYWYYVEQTMR
ncbi:MAG: hypothetical protein AABX98_05900 [Nanoarchaeota archaeon]